MTITPRVRTFALTAHVIASVVWLGDVATFLVLAIAGLTELQLRLRDRERAAAARGEDLRGRRIGGRTSVSSRGTARSPLLLKSLNSLKRLECP